MGNKTRFNAPDTFGAGNRYTGWRTVKKGGILKFDDMTLQSCDLRPYEGDRVEIEFDGACSFSNGPFIIRDERGNKITTIKECEQEKEGQK